MADRLGSEWGSLSPHLLATIYPVTAQGSRDVDAGPEVFGPITDATLEVVANWQSPFEQSGAEQKMPMIAGMLQSGTLQSYAETLAKTGDDATLKGRIASEIIQFSKSAQGRTGMTKLNSTQVFTGAPPVKLTCMMHFRAFRDPVSEVREATDQVMKWSLARTLAPNGNIVSAIQAFERGDGFLAALFPSEAPQMVALRYGGMLLSPMVIESCSQPVTVPRSRDGDPISVSMQITLSTLTALDRGDWARARAGQPTLLFNNS